MQLPTFSRAAFGTLALAAAALCAPAHAALDIGDPAPRFTATAALGGKTFRYSLADALAKGPVVLYFFPAADSNECSIEAHAFAEAIDQFAALGATVIGVSADDIDTLSKFSVKSCQSRFPVASDESKSVIQSFDAVMQTILVAGCLYMRQREGITPAPDAPVWEVAKAARLLGMHLAVRGAEIVVVPVGTPGCRPMGIVDRDAYDQTDALARHTDISSDPLRGAA